MVFSNVLPLSESPTPMFQMILGGFGLVGFLLKIIGPITITVLISLIGLCLAGVAAGSASQNWGIALL